MAEERTPRTHDTRAESARPSDSYVPTSVLPAPNPQEGWEYHWVRTSTLGHADNTNVSHRFREGWVPVKATEVPELKLMSDVGSRFEGCLEVGGLLLCKMPKEKVSSRRKYYEQAAQRQMDAVDNNYLRENDPRMPMLKPERSTRTEFGRG